MDDETKLAQFDNEKTETYQYVVGFTSLDGKIEKGISIYAYDEGIAELKAEKRFQDLCTVKGWNFENFRITSVELV